MALPHHSHYHRETQKIMLRVQQISRQPIPPVRTDRGRAPVPAGAICIPVNTQEKKQLARANSAEARPGQARRALCTAPAAAQRRAGQARGAQPRGPDPLLSLEGGRSENRPPRAPGQAQLWGTELCGSCGPCGPILLSGPGAARAQSSYREQTSSCSPDSRQTRQSLRKAAEARLEQLSAGGHARQRKHTNGSRRKDGLILFFPKQS